MAKQTDFLLLELTELFSAMSLSSIVAPRFHSDRKPAASKPLQDLPSEILLEIYKSFDQIASIVALNSTSRMFYDIWRLDPARISSAVLPRSIEYFDTTVDIQEAEDRQQKVDPYRRYDPLKTQRKLLQRCLATSLVSSNIAEYAITLASNERLVRIAQKADMLSKFCKASCLNSIGRERIIHAFYRIWNLTIRNSRNATQLKTDMIASLTSGDDRDNHVRALGVQELDDLGSVVRFLIYECSGKELIKLGISRPLKAPTTTGSRTCLVSLEWAFEFGRIASLSHDWATARYLASTKKFALYKDC